MSKVGSRANVRVIKDVRLNQWFPTFGHGALGLFRSVPIFKTTNKIFVNFQINFKLNIIFEYI